MTARDIYKKALSLLNYEDEQLFKNNAVEVINRVLSDIFFSLNGKCEGFDEIKDLSDELNLSAVILHDVMPYGVAMFFAQSQSDGDMQSLYATLYNRKRGRLSHTETVTDVLPWV